MDELTLSFYIIACIILYSIFVFVTRKILSKRQFYEHASKFDGPPTLPLIGNASLFTGSTTGMLHTVLELGRRYPTSFRIWFGHRLYICLNTPEELRIVCQSRKTLDKGHLSEFLRPWVGTGLFTARASTWRKQRRVIQPAFNSTSVKSFVEVFAEQSEIIADQIARYVDGPEFEIHQFIASRTLEMICETSMGVKIASQIDDNCLYPKAVSRVFSQVCERLGNLFLYPDFIFHCTQLHKRQQEDIKFLHNFTKNIITTRKNELLERNTRSTSVGSENHQCDSTPRRETLLDHLLQLSQNDVTFTEDALRQEVDTIVAAGSDTTTATSTYVLWMLASHPDIQEKVYQELCDIFGDDDRAKVRITSDHLSRMQYLERVIKETLRLFPAIPVLIRTVDEDLDIGERTLPKGSTVVLGIIQLHRNEKYWPNPKKFDPDRFLPEEVVRRSPYTYLPFAGGLRTCIGSRYAMMSIKTLTATLLRKYILKKDNIVPIDSINFSIELVLKPVNPITLRLEKRRRQVAVH